MTRWLSEHEQQAWRGLLTMTARLQARLNRELQETSALSIGDYEVLVALSEAPCGRLRSYELAGILLWEQSRLSHHLTRMQSRGLVTRQACPSDRRGAFVVLTERGRTAIEQAAPGHVESVRNLVFDALTAEQVDELRRLSERILARLEETSEPGGCPGVSAASSGSDEPC